MDWNRGIERNREALSRIVAMLVGLAVLAERAGSRSFPVRWLVLSVLRSAEAVAREFVAETTRTPQPFIDGIPEIRNAPADAVILAWRFRALAAALWSLLSRTWRSPCRNACMDIALRQLAPPPGQLFLALGGWTRNPNDTS